MPPNFRQFIPVVTFFSYAILSLVLIWHHEPWRDELQCWEIARQSTTLSDLFHNARYEGHPSAWYLLLFAITRFTSSFVPVQSLHWFIALASVALVLWRSPFAHWQKVLLVFGYFFLYEYGVLTRNYALGILLAFSICSLMQHRQRHWLVLCALLFALMQCSMFALLLACALSAPLFLKGINAIKNGEINWRQWTLGGIIVLGGLLISAIDMAPPPDTAYAIGWKWANPEWRFALGGFFRAMLPMPPWELHGWGHHILEKLPLDWGQRTTVECVGAILLLLGCVWSLRKSPFALSFFLLAWLGISLFLAVKFQGYIRHLGHFYLAYIMALWMGGKALNQGFTKTYFTFMLLVQLASAVPMAYFDLRYPFSQSRMVADFLRQHHLESRFIVGDYDYAISPIAFHLRRPIYYPNQRKSGSYLLWSNAQAALKYDDIVPVATDLCQAHGNLLLLTSYPIPSENMNDSVKVVKAFFPAIEGSEEYYLYEVYCGN